MRIVIVVAAFASLGMHCQRNRVPPQLPPAAQVVASEQPICGDGAIGRGEQCDDGNVAPGDGCDACTLEAPQCGPGTDRVVWRWQCDGSPSRCALAACTAGEDCPPDIATRAVTARVRLEGFVDPTRPPSARVTGGGLACTCRDTLAGLVCDAGCMVEVPTCARTTVTASGGAFARWSWACAGTGASCIVQPDAPAMIEAAFAHAPITVAGSAILPGVWNLRVLGIDAHETALVSGSTALGSIGAVRIAPDGYRTFVAAVSRSGDVLFARDLGNYDRDTVQAGALAEDGTLWVVVQHRDPDASDDAPTFAAIHLDGTGRELGRAPLGHLAGAPVVAAGAGGSLALAAHTQVREDGEWRAHRFIVSVLRADGRRRWTRSETSPYVWVNAVAMRFVNDDLMLGGAYTLNSDAPGSLLRTRADRLRRFVLRFDDRGRARQPYELPVEETLEWPQVAFAPDGSTITLASLGDPVHLAMLERRDPSGHVVWTQPVAKRDPTSGSFDPRSLAATPALDRVAFSQRELDHTQEYDHARMVVRVVDHTGTYRHAWSIPVQPPAKLGLALAGIVHDRAVLAGDVTGPLAIGHVRFAPGSRTAGVMLWLDPEPRRGVAR